MINTEFVKTRLVIERLPYGGYTVREDNPVGRQFICMPLFAATDIDDALGWIKTELERTAT